MIETKKGVEEDVALKTLKLIEDGIAEISHKASVMSLDTKHPKYEMIHGCIKAANRAVNLAWALRTYPEFDIKALAMIRKVKVNVRIPAKAAREVELLLPTFAFMDYRNCEFGQVMLNLSNPSIRTDEISWGYGSTIEYNREALKEDYRYIGDTQLAADIPAIPMDVRRRVHDIVGRFDGLILAWETDWSAVPKPDPLVIGRICGYSFLVDQFDATKLERYVTSEFSVKRG